MKKVLFLLTLSACLTTHAVEFDADSRVVGKKNVSFSYKIKSERRFVLYMKNELNTVLEWMVLTKKNPQVVKKAFESQFSGVELLNLEINQ